jgi:hypothetical protein
MLAFPAGVPSGDRGVGQGALAADAIVHWLQIHVSSCCSRLPGAGLFLWSRYGGWWRFCLCLCAGECFCWWKKGEGECGGFLVWIDADADAV